jgi:hypothetical protein
MKRVLAMLLAGFFAASCAYAADPGFLLRVERHLLADRTALLDQSVPVVMELSDCFLAMASKEDVAALEKLGYSYDVLDSSPKAWDYYQVGLRPDSDLKAVMDLGTIIHTEENWVLLRVVPAMDLGPLYDARVFIAPVPKEPMAKPRPSEPLSLRPPGPQNAVPLVLQMVNSVNTADIDSYWTQITTNPPTGSRYSSGAGCTDAANYVLGQFQSLGLQSRNITYNAGHAPNTEGQITGAINPSVIYLVEGHLDDLPSSGSAPGADDNASGSVNVLEAAKILSCYAFKNTVRFLTVTGEEQGLLGSTAYANSSYSLGENIQGVINMDMPGWAGDGLPASGENLDLNYDSNSTSLGAFYAQCATDYSTGLPVDAFLCPSLNASDHYQFWVRGYKAVCGITDNEGYCNHEGHYPYYHTANDTIANCGTKTFFYSVVKTTIAALAELGEPFKIAMDKGSYGCSVPVTVIVGDRDLNTNSATTQTATIQIWSTRESAPESLALTEQGVNSMIFKGTINLAGSAPVHGDALLSVDPGDTITARYVDAADCNGATNVTYDATSTVSSDCTGPVITNVLVTNLTDTTATVTWTTDEAANSRVIYGTSKPPGTSKDDLSAYVTSHSIILTGLSPCTVYYFSAYSEDAVGNWTTNNNGGNYFTFTTYGRSYLFGPDDVEGGVLSWVVSPTTGTDIWHQDLCKAASGTHSWKVGKSDSPTCTAQYASSMSNYFLTWNANINVGAAGHGYHLRFNEWYDTESNTGCTYDPIRTQISTNGGTSWTTLATNCGASGGWLARDYDLAAYTGSTVRIRFYFTSDSSGNGLGWFVDDINISKSQSCTAEMSYQSNTWADSCSGTGTGVGNGYVDPGEEITVHPTLQNTGSQGATGISATLSTSTPNITIAGATATYPDLAVGASGACNAPHFTYSVGTGVACGTVINFTLAITAAAGGGPWTQNFTATVGNSVAGGTITDFSENFSSVTTPNLPTGWSLSNTSGNPWRTATTACTTIGLQYPYNTSTAANSWAYTPGIALVAGTTYTLNFNQKVQSASFPEIFEVKSGTAATPAGQTITVLASATYTNTTCTARTPTFTVPSSGTYFIGFHCTSGADEYYLWIDDIALTHTSTPSCTVQACTPGSAPPGEAAPGNTPATSQGWTNKTAHNWPSTSGATSYKVYRGIQGQLANLLNSGTDSCVKYDGASTNCAVNDDPAGEAGRFYWYLVTASNTGGEGTAGNHTNGAGGPRVVNSTGNCP